METKKSIVGIVVKGLGEGAFFMSIPHYKKEIKKKLGFDAYEGTLNLKVKEKYTKLLKNLNKIIIEGFKSGNKIYYGAICYNAKINNINGAIIIPEKSRHEKDIIEFIAPVNLKSELKLKDGDKVKIELLK